MVKHNTPKKIIKKPRYDRDEVGTDKALTDDEILAFDSSDAMKNALAMFGPKVGLDNTLTES